MRGGRKRVVAHRAVYHQEGRIKWVVVDKCRVGYLADSPPLLMVVEEEEKWVGNGRRCAGSRHVEHVLRAVHCRGVFIIRWVLILFRVVGGDGNVMMSVVMMMRVALSDDRSPSVKTEVKGTGGSGHL